MSDYYYQPPAEHDDHLKRFMIMSALFFSSIFVVLLILIWQAEHWVRLIPPSYETRLTKPYELFLEQIRSEDPELREAEQSLQVMTMTLAKAINLPEEQPVQVHLIRNETPNAFALLGGHIIVHTGLLSTVDNENALSMVLAHELAHLKNRDPLISGGRVILIYLLSSSMGVDLSGGRNLMEIGQKLGIAAFSRDMESRADIAALHALQNHYGHVGGATDFFQTLLDRGNLDSKTELEWLATHPRLQQRIVTIKLYALEQGWVSEAENPMPGQLGISPLAEGGRSENGHTSQ